MSQVRTDKLKKRFRRRAYKFADIPKSSEELCGEACIRVLGLLSETPTQQAAGTLQWVGELGSAVLDMGIPCRMKCADSTLYRAFVQGTDPQNEGVMALENFCGSGGEIISEPPHRSGKIIGENPVICCVSSARWNFSAKMKGGHYILVLPIKKRRRVLVIVPKERLCTAEWVREDFVRYAMRGAGEWRIECLVQKTEGRLNGLQYIKR